MSSADGQVCCGQSRTWMSRQQLSHIPTTSKNFTDFAAEATTAADATTTTLIINTLNVQAYNATNLDDFKPSPETAELFDRSLQIIN
jgi:hypothetical protein